MDEGEGKEKAKGKISFAFSQIIVMDHERERGGVFWFIIS